MGEVESPFGDAAYRPVGIRTALVTRGLARMDSPATVRKRIFRWAFYRKSGFYPRMTLLEQKTDPD
jgi:hypothetical protein